MTVVMEQGGDQSVEQPKKLTEKLKNPDIQKKFGDQVGKTNAAQRAEEYKNGEREQTFVQTRNSNSTFPTTLNHHEPIKTEKTTTQEVSYKILPLNPNDPKNKPEIRLLRLHPQIQNAINDIQGELNNSTSDSKIKMLINRPIMSHIPGDFPIQIPENSRILSMRDPKLRGKIISYDSLVSLIKK